MKTKNKRLSIILIFFVFCILSSYIYLNKIYDYCYIFLIFLSIIYFLNNIKLDKCSNKEFIIYISLILCENIVSSLLNVKSINNFKEIIKYFYYFGLIIIFIFCSMNTKYKHNFLYYFAILMIPINIYGIFEFFVGKSYIYQYINSDAKNWQVTAFFSENYRPFSVFINPIVYGNVLVCLFWIYKYLYKNYKFNILFMLLTLLNLYSTKSRSSWIAFIVTYFIYIVSKVYNFWKKKNENNFTKVKLVSKETVMKKIFLIIVVFLIVTYFHNNIILGFTKIYNRFSIVFNDQSNDISKLQRLGTINLVNEYMTDNGTLKFLFGNGFGASTNFMKNNIVVIPGFTTTDNQYVSYFFDFGLIGLLLYLSLIIKAVFNYFNNIYDDYYRVYILIFLSICVNMFFYEIHGWKVINFLFMLCLSVFILDGSFIKESKIEN